MKGTKKLKRNERFNFSKYILKFIFIQILEEHFLNISLAEPSFDFKPKLLALFSNLF